jgi:hypothetical protein
MTAETSGMIDLLRDIIDRCLRIRRIIDDGHDLNQPGIWRPTIAAHAKVCADDAERALAASAPAPPRDDAALAKAVVSEWWNHDVDGDIEAEDAKLAERIAAALARARADEREECAETCIRIWREASNERTDSALTSYMQNALSHGCIASEKAIRARKP